MARFGSQRDVFNEKVEDNQLASRKNQINEDKETKNVSKGEETLKDISAKNSNDAVSKVKDIQQSSSLKRTREQTKNIERKSSEKEKFNEKNERQITRTLDKAEKIYQEANLKKTSVSEKRKLYSKEFENNVKNIEKKLNEAVKVKDQELEQIGKSKSKDCDEYKKVVEERDKYATQLEKLQPILKDAIDTRRDQLIDEAYEKVSETKDKVSRVECTESQKKELYSATFVKEGEQLKDKLKDEIGNLENKISKIDATKQENFSEWKKLQGEKNKREEELAGVESILDEAKDFQRTKSVEDSKERIWMPRGNSESEKHRDFLKDRECARYNKATMDGLRKDIHDLNIEKDMVYVKISKNVNETPMEKLGENKTYKELHKQYDTLSEKVEACEKQYGLLKQYNDKLAEINGLDKKGENKLQVKEYKLTVDEENVQDMFETLKDCSEKKVSEKDFDEKGCRQIVETISKSEKEVMPALEEQISNLDKEIKIMDNYLLENNQDKWTQEHKSNLEKSRDEKIGQLISLQEGTNYLKDKIQVEGGKFSAKCLINPDNTYTIERRWTNTKEQITDKGFYENVRQFYFMGYDRNSKIKFDENGDVISKEYSFKAKGVGYYSNCKYGNEKINVHNKFEGGFANFFTEYNRNEEGIKGNIGTSVLKIENSTTLNMLNKEIMKVNANFAWIEATGAVEIEQWKAKVSASIHDGVNASGDVLIGKRKILQGAIESWDNKKGFEYEIEDGVSGTSLNDKLESSEDILKYSVSVGDKIHMFEKKYENGTTEVVCFCKDIDEILNPADGFEALIEVEEHLKDIRENGILKDETTIDKENILFQTKELSGGTSAKLESIKTQDVQEKNSADMRRTEFEKNYLNASESIYDQDWIDQELVVYAMKKSHLGSVEIDAVENTIGKIREGKSINQDEIADLHYAAEILNENGYEKEARGINNLYNPLTIAIKDEYGESYQGAKKDIVLDEAFIQCLEGIDIKSWRMMSSKEKKQQISLIKAHIEKELELKFAPQMEYYKAKGTGEDGLYNHETKTVYINVNNINDIEKMIYTVAHELRHAWQYQTAESPKTKNENEIKNNLKKYITPEQDYEQYGNQVMEKDARVYAWEIVSKWRMLQKN